MNKGNIKGARSIIFFSLKIHRIRLEVEFRRIWIRAKLFGLNEVVRYLRNPLPSIPERLLRAFGAEIGPQSKIKGPLFLDNVLEDENSRHDFGHLEIGKNCYLGSGVFMDLANKIAIEDNVVLSANVSIVTHADCNRSPVLEKIYPRQCRSVRICRGAWIGFGAIILNGVTIGENTVVASSSLVKDDCAAGALYAGTPAKLKNNLNIT